MVSQTFLPAVPKFPPYPKVPPLSSWSNLSLWAFPLHGVQDTAQGAEEAAVPHGCTLWLLASFEWLASFENLMIWVKWYQSFTCTLVFWGVCFISQKQGVEVCKQQYLTSLLQLLCLQRLRHKSLGEHFETGYTLRPDEKTQAGSSTIWLHPVLHIFFSWLKLS